MIKRWQRLFNLVNMSIDFFILLGCYYGATVIWLSLVRKVNFNPTIGSKIAIGVGFALAFSIILSYYIFGLYSTLRSKPISHDLRWVFSSNALAVLMIIGLLYIGRIIDFSRGVLLVFYFLSVLSILLKRLLMRFLLAFFRKKGLNQKHVVLLGSGLLAEQYALEILRHPAYGYTIDGFIGLRDVLLDLPYIGTWESIGKSYLEKCEADEVIVALDQEYIRYFPDIIDATEKSGAKLLIVPYFNNLIPTNTCIESVGDCKLINVRTTPFDSPFNLIVKRLFDIVLSCILLLLCSPILVFAATGVKFSSPGPIIFKQLRVGKNKRLFEMYKFRSMRINDSSSKAWTTHDDPRKTVFGKFIRKTSIDELPQLWNVLKGDMSLIGPRPEIPFYVNQFKDTIPLYMLKHLVRPGITGWAQVNGLRGDTSIEERIKKDIWYIENWTFGLDLRIVVMTFFGGIINKEL